MAIILSVTDFQGGKYDIPDAAHPKAAIVARVTECITNNEKIYIYLLLGVTLGDLFITWVQNVSPPVNVDYTKIKDPFALDIDGCEDMIISKGMKEYLKACIFYEYTKNAIVNSQAGAVVPDVETSKALGPAGTLRYAENKFNELIDTTEAIQWYCYNNPTAFPDFNGRRIAMKAANYFV